MSSQTLTAELVAVREFMSSTLPFDFLSDEQIHPLIRKIQIFYCRRTDVLEHFMAAHHLPVDAGLVIVRTGALDVWSAEGRLVDRLAEGDSLWLQTLSSAEANNLTVRAIEDSLIYYLPEPALAALRADHLYIDRFLVEQSKHRLHKLQRQTPEAGDMLRPLAEIMCAKVVSVAPDCPVQQAAELMTEQRISSLLVVEQSDAEAAVLLGILTDRDIRSRVVARNLALDTPVGEVMTRSLICLSPDHSLFDATLLMTQKNIHHLPIAHEYTDASGVHFEPIGMVTASDLMLAREDDPVFLVQHLSRQNRVEDLQSTLTALPGLVVQWQAAGMRAHQVSHILTAISDTTAIRLIEIYQQAHGPAPVAFCWLGFGSQGREEQLLGADQDNALLISDDLRPDQEQWFTDLADFVCDGLNACGYVYCPGNIMASNDEWRLPLTGWQSTVSNWATTPTPDAVMRVSIFFDIRSVYGDQQLCHALQSHMLKVVQGNQLFLRCLAENVVDSTPPLGIFRQFVLETSGEHSDQLNLKKRGVLPITEIARIHALANQLFAVNTYARLKALGAARQVHPNDTENLIDAAHVIAQIRLQAQAEQIKTGQPISHYLDPDSLSQLQRKQLRDAFAVVADALSAVRRRYMPMM